MLGAGSIRVPGLLGLKVRTPGCWDAREAWGAGWPPGAPLGSVLGLPCASRGDRAEPGVPLFSRLAFRWLPPYRWGPSMPRLLLLLLLLPDGWCCCCWAPPVCLEAPHRTESTEEAEPEVTGVWPG